MRRPSRPKFYIYTLWDPLTGNVRYVGYTDDIRSRYSQHVSSCEHAKHHNGRWIAKLRRAGWRPVLRVVDWSYSSEEALDTLEPMWIALYRSLGAKLTNMTDGGEGFTGASHPTPTLEARQAVTRSLRAQWHSDHYVDPNPSTCWPLERFVQQFTDTETRICSCGRILEDHEQDCVNCYIRHCALPICNMRPWGAALKPKKLPPVVELPKPPKPPKPLKIMVPGFRRCRTTHYHAHQPALF